MFKFSVDYLTGQKTTPQTSESSDDEALSPRDNIPSPRSSDDASSNFSDSLSPGSEKRSFTYDPETKSRSEAKPSHSYIALISMAILNRDDKKMMLCDIYNFIMEKFPYYNNKDKAWRNSIRHNLSLNECFVKSGRADNGKGNYWSIHPACVDDFSRGDFRRRQARRRARKSALSREGSMSDLSLACRYNLGYVPMTSSTVGSAPAFRPSISPVNPTYYTQGFSPYPVSSSGTMSQSIYQGYQPPTTYASSPLSASAVPSSSSHELYSTNHREYTYPSLPY